MELQTNFTLASDLQILDSRQPAFTFELPPELEAHEPPEARGLSRDGVRLMVSFRSDSRTPKAVHARFRDLPRFLQAGDVLVVNTSATD